MAALQLIRSLLLCCSGAALLGGRGAAAEQTVPGLLERDVTLTPGDPVQVKVPIGQAKFLRFSCEGGPADVVISMSTYAMKADPLLFLSLDPDSTPSFKQHDASSFGQWREDAAGDHYVIAKAVGPQGGILGLVNMRHFAGQELDGLLSIHCTFIVAFDTLFWDHLRSSAVCPVGQHIVADPQQRGHPFCSGYGQCSRHGVCECDSNHVGPACEHEKADMVVAAEGKYRFKVATGRYQYFRVRVPPKFPGGFLKVQEQSSLPLVVLVSKNDLPTKTNFELSNFDDWVNRQLTSVLKYKVPAPNAIPTGEDAGMYGQPMPPPGLPGLPPGPGGAAAPYVGGPGLRTGLPPRGAVPGMPGPQQPPYPGTGRRLLSAEDGDSVAWADEEVIDLELSETGELTEAAPPRRRRLELADESMTQVQCPTRGPGSAVSPTPDSQTCRTEAFRLCEEDCRECVRCVNGNGVDCQRACDECAKPGCVKTLALCAGEVSCESEERLECEERCGSCMACFDSNDRSCSGCGCCVDSSYNNCLAINAKCLGLASRSAAAQEPYNRFVFVGVYNHAGAGARRPGGGGGSAPVGAVADISLTADPNFERDDLPSSWLADLYDKFVDVQDYEVQGGKVYPSGETFVYRMRLTEARQNLQVRLYHDRATLIELDNTATSGGMKLHFLAYDANVTHVLSSTLRAPKTLFDFDTVHRAPGRGAKGMVEIEVTGKPTMWCAVFGAADGLLTIQASAFGAPQAAPVNFGFALGCVFALLCALLVLGAIYGGAQSISERWGLDTSVPLSDRLANWGLGRSNPHESTASLTRSGSLSGYVGSEDIDRSVEDQYLHRGGIGDDGI